MYRTQETEYFPQKGGTVTARMPRDSSGEVLITHRTHHGHPGKVKSIPSNKASNLDSSQGGHSVPLHLTAKETAVVGGIVACWSRPRLYSYSGRAETCV